MPRRGRPAQGDRLEPVTRAADELGAHVSVAGGLALAPARGRELGCGAIQIFLKNQRQWAAPPLDPAAARAFRVARRRAGIRHAFAHGSYLVNLATPVPAAWRQAVDTFTDELQRAEALGLGCLVVHPGSHMGAGREAGLDAVARAVDEALALTPRARVRVALENTAGAGRALGGTFEDLAGIIGRVRRSERVGVGLDTCHLFGAGYDMRTPAADAAAEGADRARRAARREGRADVLAEGHQQVVVTDPEPPRQPPAQRHLGLLRVARANIAEPVADPVHVRVHADAGLVEAHRHHEVGRLAADTLEGEQGVDVVRHAPAEALQQIAAQPEDHACLRAIEADRIDQRLDLPRGQAQHGGGRVGDCEEPRGGGAGRRVLRAQRQDAGHEHAEGVALLLGDQRQRGAVPARLRPPQPADDARDVYRLSLMDSSSVRARGASLTVQSATILGARSWSTRANSCRASG